MCPLQGAPVVAQSMLWHECQEVPRTVPRTAPRTAAVMARSTTANYGRRSLRSVSLSQNEEKVHNNARQQLRDVVRSNGSLNRRNMLLFITAMPRRTIAKTLDDTPSYGRTGTEM